MERKLWQMHGAHWKYFRFVDELFSNRPLTVIGDNLLAIFKKGRALGSSWYCKECWECLEGQVLSCCPFKHTHNLCNSNSYRVLCSFFLKKWLIVLLACLLYEDSVKKSLMNDNSNSGETNVSYYWSILWTVGQG